jgi:chaperone modulatory protein CbpM
MGAWTSLRPAPGDVDVIYTRLEFLSRTKLDQQTLDIWIEEEWLIPEAIDAEFTFSEADIARARLISDLREELGVNSEGVGVILHLLDQMHGLRSVMVDLVESARRKDGNHA